MKLSHSPTFLPFNTRVPVPSKLEAQPTNNQDWHPADIIAALRKKGTSLAAESRAAGLSSSTLANALTKPWAKGEFLISEAIGVPAFVIWPSRYFDSKTNQPIPRPMRVTARR